jgi:outer membrane receptor for ferrienterochelin and colicin
MYLPAKALIRQLLTFSVVMSIKYIFWGILVLLPGWLMAQTPEASPKLTPSQMTAEDLQVLEAKERQVVVSASRSAKNADLVPITVHVVSGEEIHKNGYISLTDVLKQVPGFRVSQPGSGRKGETFLMRGLLGNRYTKILLNGIPIQPSVLDGMPLGEQLPIQQAERIEIIYGTASAMYGADAMAGVINIIMPQSEKSAFAQANITSQTLGGYIHANFTAGGKLGKNQNILRYMIYGGQSRRNDQNVKDNHNEVFAPRTYLTEREQRFWDNSVRDVLVFFNGTLDQVPISNLPHESQLVGWQLDWRKWRFSYNYTFRRDHSSLGSSPVTQNYGQPNNYLGERIQRVTLSREHSTETFSSLTNLSYLNYRMDNGSSFGTNFSQGAGGNTGYVYSASDDLFVEHLFTFRPGKGAWEFVVGGSGQYSGNLPETNILSRPFEETTYHPFSTRALPENPDFARYGLGSFGYNPLTFYNLAGFAQIYFTKHKFTFLGGLRGDYNSRYRGIVYPRLALSYQLPDKSSLRVAMGSAYRAPAANQAFASQAALMSVNRGGGRTETQPIFGFVPNPELRPEALASVELGWRKRFAKSILLDINAFAHMTMDMITAGTTSIGFGNRAQDVAQYQNTSDERTVLYSLQTALRAENVVPRIKLGADVGISLSQGQTNLASEHQIDGYRLMPSFIGQWRLHAEPLRRLYLAVEGQTLGRALRSYLEPNGNILWEKYRYIPGYTNLDVVMRYNLSKQLSGYVRVNNLTNAQYGGIDATGTSADMIYNPQRGRLIYFGISFRFE